MTDKLVSDIKIGGRTLAQFQKAFTRDAAIEEYVAAGGDREEARQMTKEDMFLEMYEIGKDKMPTMEKGENTDVEIPTEDPAKSEEPAADAGSDTKKTKPKKSDKQSTSKKRNKKSTKSTKSETKAKAIQKKAKSAKELSDDNIAELFGKKDPLDVVLKEGLLFKMDTHCWWGKSSRVPEDMMNNAPKKILKGVQALIDEKHIAPLNSYRQRGERVVIKNGFPFIGMRGVYFVPKKLIPKTLKGLDACQADFFEERDEFMKNFTRYKEQWAEYCKSKNVRVPDEAWYPNKVELKNKFQFEWTSFAFTLPDKELGLLTEEQYDQAVRNQREQAVKFLQSQLTTIALKFEEIMTKLSERLESGESIKPKSLSSLRSFMEAFDAINVTNNADLSKLVSRMGKVLGNRSAKDINESDKIRDRLKSKVGTLTKSVTTLIDSDAKFKRAMDF
jgi:hypothetical protein